MTDDLQRLVERIEGATGPCAGLDADIEHATGRWSDHHLETWARWQECGEAMNPPMSSVPVSPNRYTGSMDAVRTLIDPSDEWELSTIYNIARATVGLNRDQQTSWPGSGEHQGADPVLALLAAALRARLTQEQSNDQ